MANTNWSNGFKVSNASATQGPFELLGGKYGVTALGTFGGGNIHLQILGPDGTTYVDVGSTTNFTANGYAAVDLPPCEVQIAITTASAVYASVIPISNRR
jgi:hypothetical protein